MLSNGPQNLNSIAGNFDISRPAISQHIKTLVQCDLLIIRKQGREKYCEAKVDKLIEITSWVDECRKIWHARFDALDAHLQNIQNKNQEA